MNVSLDACSETSDHRLDWAMRGRILTLVGIAFAARALIGLTGADFWSASTALDYASVWTYSLALLLIAPAILILVRLAASGRIATVAASVVASGAILAAVANGIEDGLGYKDFGELYLLGATILVFALIALAAVMVFGRRKVFALVPTLTVVGLFAFSEGGGFLIGATWTIVGVLVLTGRIETGQEHAAIASVVGGPG